jgi:Protein of unknown function (DUF3096)
MLGYPSVF